MNNIKVLYFIFIFVNTLPYSLSQVAKEGMFNRAANKRIPYFISQYSTRSAIKCCDTCLAHKDCQSVNYNHVTGSCQVVPQPILAVSFLSISDTSWSVYSKRVSEWFLVFVGLAGNGVNVHDSYINGTDTVTNDVNCMTLNMAACQQNYRCPIIDSWSLLKIAQVKYSLYKNGQEVAYAMFTGTGSDVTNWFSKERRSNSSWTQALTNLSFNFFSMKGDSPTRRFFISAFYNNCPGDKAFTLAVTGYSRFTCNFDSQSAYPQFIYSTTTSPATFASGNDTDYADYMAIFIK